jgi:hypothetical protein
MGEQVVGEQTHLRPASKRIELTTYVIKNPIHGHLADVEHARDVAEGRHDGVDGSSPEADLLGVWGDREHPDDAEHIVDQDNWIAT